MKSKKKSKAMRLLTGLLTLCVILGASFIGVYAVAAPSNRILDESKQKMWLEKFYADEEVASFSVVVSGISTNSSLLADSAQKAYDDEEIAFFSILADYMDESKLESWLDRALEDGKWNFQSVLFDKLERSGEFDELEEKQEREWDKVQIFSLIIYNVCYTGYRKSERTLMMQIFIVWEVHLGWKGQIENAEGFYHVIACAGGGTEICIFSNTTD